VPSTKVECTSESLRLAFWHILHLQQTTHVVIPTQCANNIVAAHALMFVIISK